MARVADASAISALEQYFSTLEFRKTGYKGSFAVYGAKVPAMFQSNSRYIFVIVDATRTNTPLYDSSRLANLPWVSLQTRLIDKDSDQYRLPLQQWRVKANVSDAKLLLQGRGKIQTEYLSEDGSLRAALLHDPAVKSIYQHHSSVMVSTAIETFRAIFTVP